MVAFDFDETFVDIHTGGNWLEPATSLATHVRPEAACLMGHSLDTGIAVAVVTFSTQTELIQQVLRHALGQTAPSIPVIGGNDGFHSRGRQYIGKQRHLHLAMEEWNRHPLANGRRRKPADITPTTALLIDDDSRNIDIAKSDGYATLFYQPDSSLFEADFFREVA